MTRGVKHYIYIYIYIYVQGRREVGVHCGQGVLSVAPFLRYNCCVHDLLDYNDMVSLSCDSLKTV